MSTHHAQCPNDADHHFFLVTSEGGRVWIVDQKGGSALLLKGEDDYLKPCFEDNWVCRVCGQEAVFLKLEEAAA